MALGTRKKPVVNESEVMGDYTTYVDEVCFLIIDSLGTPTHVPYENVTFDTDEGGKIIC